jgi:hypothetical protein
MNIAQKINDGLYEQPPINASDTVNDFERIPDEAYADEDAGRARAGNDGQERAAPRDDGFPTQRLDEMQSTARPTVVQGLGLAQGTVAAIVGLPNSGKTAFAISLGLHVAGRRERWLTRKVKGGPAIYFAAEAPGSVTMRAKAAVTRQAFGKPSFYVTAAAPGIGGEYSSDADVDRIISTIAQVAALEGEPVKLVFLDTLAACLAGGDENGDGMIRLTQAAQKIAKQSGVCVILIHHPSKGDAASLRGHGSLAAACDAILRIEIEDLTGVRIATLIKARDDPAGLQLRFELEQVVLEQRDSFGDLLTTIVVMESAQGAPRPRPSAKARSQQQLLAELERRYRTGETAWDKATICKAGRDLGMHRNSAMAALDGLVRGGFVSGNDARMILIHPPERT